MAIAHKSENMCLRNVNEWNNMCVLACNRNSKWLQNYIKIGLL